MSDRPTAADLRYVLAWLDKDTLREMKADPQGAVIFAKSQQDEASNDGSTP